MGNHWAIQCSCVQDYRIIEMMAIFLDHLHQLRKVNKLVSFDLQAFAVQRFHHSCVGHCCRLCTKVLDWQWLPVIVKIQLVLNHSLSNNISYNRSTSIAACPHCWIVLQFGVISEEATVKVFTV